LGAVIEAFVQLPTKLPVDLGIGVHLGAQPSAFVVLSKEIHSRVELFVANRFMSLLVEDDNGQHFFSNATTVGASIALDPKVSLLVGAEYYYMPRLTTFAVRRGQQHCNHERGRASQAERP